MTEEPEKQAEEVVTLTFENAANEGKTWQVVSVTGDLLRDYVGRAAKQLFTPVPTRVGISTKDGAIIQNWSDKTVAQIVDSYQTNHYVIGTPDQLGLPLFFGGRALMGLEDRGSCQSLEGNYCKANILTLTEQEIIN
jgi:hypothetical protein